MLLFQNDGALPHQLQDVCNFLDEPVPGQWLGCKYPISWPPSTTDLTPFFLKGLTKDQVYEPVSVETLQELQHRTTATMESNSNTNTLTTGWLQMKYSFNVHQNAAWGTD
jgi:hypothetical protein